MGSSDKVWVIDSNRGQGAAPRRPRPAVTPRRDARQTRSKPRSTTPRNARAVEDAPRDSRGGARERHRRRFLARLALGYGLGPLALPLWTRSRGSLAWAGVGAACLIAAVVAAVFRTDALAWLASRSVRVEWALVAWSGAVTVGITAWSRAILVAASSELRQCTPPPAWIRNPATIGALGGLIPGLGFALTGHPRRAALSWWILAPLVGSAAVLTQAPGLWRSELQFVPQLPDRAIEQLVAAAACTLVLAGIAWTFQALDGARLAVAFRAVDPRAGARAQILAVALLVAVTTFAVGFKPAPFARTLHDFSIALDHVGYELIPLQLERAAVHLDPSQPLYGFELAELLDERGNHDEAHRARAELMMRWKQCAAMERLSGDAVAELSLTAATLPLTDLEIETAAVVP